MPKKLNFFQYFHRINFSRNKIIMKLVFIGILTVSIFADTSHDVRKYYAASHDIKKYNDIYKGPFLQPKVLYNSEGLRDADTSKATAQMKCDKFYNDRSEGAKGTSVVKVGEGGQSRVYKCETHDDSSKLPVVAIKMYMRPWEVRLLKTDYKRELFT